LRPSCRITTSRSGSRYGSGREQHPVDDAEDRRRRADPERERHDRDDGEAWTPDERADCITNVARRRLENRPRLNLADLVLHPFDAAQLHERGTPGVAWIHAGPELLVGQQVGIGANVGVELALDARAGKQVAQGAAPT
jgi:hypothetical protein